MVRFNDVFVSNKAQSHADYENILPPNIDLRHALYFRKRKAAYSGMHDFVWRKKLPSRVVWLNLLQIRKKLQVTVSRICMSNPHSLPEPLSDSHGFRHLRSSFFVAKVWKQPQLGWPQTTQIAGVSSHAMSICQQGYNKTSSTAAFSSSNIYNAISLSIAEWVAGSWNSGIPIDG